MEQYELPDGWICTTLGEVCTSPQYGYTTKAIRRGAGPQFLRITDISRDGVDWNTVPYCAEPPAEPSKYRLEDGDLVVGRAGSVGKAHRVTNPPDAIFASYLIRFRALEVFSKYLEYFLQSPIYWEQIEDSSTGTTMFNVNAQKLAALILPLAPLSEQQLIVEQIEALFEQSRTTREMLDEIPAMLRQFRQSVLAAAFRGELSTQNPDDEPASVLLERILEERRRRWEDDLRAKGKDPSRYTYEEPAAPDTSDLPELPERWCWANIGQLADVMGGFTKNSKRQAHSFRLPYLRVANVYSNKLALDDVQEIGILETELERVLLRKGDLLVVEGNGSADQIGRVAVWDGSIDPCVHQNHIIKARFHPVEIGKYALFWLLSPSGRDFIGDVASSTSGLYTLSLSKVAALPIPLAPLSEQRQLTNRLEALIAQVDAVGEIVETAYQRLDGVDQSILARAFRGGLVPQDPNDEPASVLLERIREQRDLENTTPTKRSKKRE